MRNNRMRDVAPEDVLYLAEKLGWPEETFGLKKLLDEGDWKAERFLNGSDRVELFHRLNELYMARIHAGQRTDGSGPYDGNGGSGD